MKHGFMKWPVAALLVAFGGLAQAAVVWDETANGDLSSNGLTPTMLTFGAGSNALHGSVGNAGAGVDRDYFTFIVAPGFTLSAVTLLPDTNVAGGASFFAMQVGPQITASPNGVGANALLGYTHYGNDFIGLNLLQFIAGGNALSAGTYSVWVQETGGPATYGLDFQVSAVPLPGAVWLLLSGLAGVTTMRRRLSSS